jgi:hypothetical protein
MRRIRARMPGACPRESEREVSKEREIAEVLDAVISAFAKFRIRSPIDWNDGEQKAYEAAYDLSCELQSVPQPAPQSETPVGTREFLGQVAGLIDSVASVDHRPEFWPVFLQSVARDIREHLTEVPATQSESEAVRLLRKLHFQIGSTQPNISEGVGEAYAECSLFLSRPAGPDWRTLAMDAWKGWQSAQMTKPMYAIRDALAAEKGGEL